MTREVVIVGAGPNGLLMAIELARAGTLPIVLERLPERSTLPKANGLVGQVIPALDCRRLFELLGGKPGPPQGVPGFQFGGLALHGYPMHVLPIPQARLEEILEQCAEDLGVEIRRGHEVTSIQQDTDAVAVTVSVSNETYVLGAQYLVAADGGRSPIRKELGIGFPGITDDSVASISGQVSFLPPFADSQTGEVDAAGLGRLRGGTFTRTERGIFAFGMFRPGVHRFAVYEWHRDPADPSLPVTLAEVRDVVSRVLGTEVLVSAPVDGAELLLRRGEGVNSRQADRYRVGRVFLVGDAAHVHSGIGGPGLNLGMQDVINLGWKLGASVHGWAPADLLDTYESERHPVGRRVLMQTRAQAALLAPGPNVTALRQLFEELLQNAENARHIGEMLAGSDARYAMLEGADAAHPLTGRWMPDRMLQTESGSVRLASIMCSAKAVLLDLAGATAIAEFARDWEDRVIHVRASADVDAAAILIRPDGYVAWATSERDHMAGLREALERWFGAPLIGKGPRSAGS